MRFIQASFFTFTAGLLFLTFPVYSEMDDQTSKLEGILTPAASVQTDSPLNTAKEKQTLVEQKEETPPLTQIKTSITTPAGNLEKKDAPKVDHQVSPADLQKEKKEAVPLTQIKTSAASPASSTEKQDTSITYISIPLTTKFSPSKNIFFQTNIGVGFLYFSGLKGNLMGDPSINFSSGATWHWRDAPLKGRLSYNRTPLFEYLLGYQFSTCFKMALSYQHQGGINIQSKALSAFPVTARSTSVLVQFMSNLSLDAILAKFYFESPYTMLWKKLATTAYLAAGVGPGWQTWSAIQVSYMRGNANYGCAVLPIRQKVSANAVWMLDMGFRTQGAFTGSTFSVLLGCKYNQWGQARSIGKITHQGAYKVALSQPVRVKTLYQFAPYLGVEWNFSPDKSAGSAYKLKGKAPNQRLPYWVNSSLFQCSRNIWTEFNAGVGFLYFSGVRANLMGKPSVLFNTTALWRHAPLKGRLSYNRTPLLEYLLGYKFNQWLKIAFSYQHQGGITLQTKVITAFSNTTVNSASLFVQLQSYLNLDAVLAKVYFDLPCSIIWGSLSTTPYLAVGVGPGWQTWNRVQGNYFSGNTDVLHNTVPYQQKISANAVWMVDTGLRVQSAYPNSLFSVSLGCKYNQWGQARNIGKMSQQGAHKIAFAQPFRIKTVYQFAPYLGVQWSFSPDLSAGESYQLKCKSPKVWLPYWVASKEFQTPASVWTQFNTGIGFLYFSGLRANLMGSPSVSFATSTQWRDAPLKGRLSYNRTPLFEYLLGHNVSARMKLALSYQHQGGIVIQSKAVSAFPFSNQSDTETVQFISNLSLDALLAKVYFELPHSMIWRSLSLNPYLAIGVGPGWQTWSKVSAVYMYGDGSPSLTNELLPLRQKIPASAVWMVDKGFRIQSVYPNSLFSVLVGCKYNQWGQARNIGKMSQQGANKRALAHPLQIKTVYQFAPYLGVQWNF